MPYIVIDAERCKGCGLCAICPKKLVVMGDLPNSQGYSVATITDPASCTGCTLCALMCPDVAISVFKESD